MPKNRVAFYLRVFTGEQTTENQHRELEILARHRGWEIAIVMRRGSGDRASREPIFGL